jgi:hypothetical protein
MDFVALLIHIKEKALREIGWGDTGGENAARKN